MKIEKEINKTEEKDKRRKRCNGNLQIPTNIDKERNKMEEKESKPFKTCKRKDSARKIEIQNRGERQREKDELWKNSQICIEVGRNIKYKRGDK